MTDYIEIRNWDKFQHADATKRGRAPVWIKTYTRLHSDDDYLDLTGHQRAVLHGLWLEYARSGRHLRLSTRSLTARLNLRVMRRDIEALEKHGFITVSPAPHHALTSPSPQLQHAVNTASHDDTSTETKGESAKRQDNVTQPSIQEEKREEKNKPLHVARAREAVDGWSGPGSNVVSFLDGRRRSA